LRSTEGWASKSKSDSRQGAGRQAKRARLACRRAVVAVTSAASSRSRNAVWLRSAALAWSSSAGPGLGGGGQPQLGDVAAQPLAGRGLAHLVTSASSAQSARSTVTSGPGRQAAGWPRRGPAHRAGGCPCARMGRPVVNADSTTRSSSARCPAERTRVPAPSGASRWAASWTRPPSRSPVRRCRGGAGTPPGFRPGRAAPSRSCRGTPPPRSRRPAGTR